MPKLRITTLAALAFAVLCLAVAIATAKRAPVFSAQVVGVAKLGDKHFSLDVLVSNHTGSAYNLMIGDLQSWNGTAWISCPDLPAAYSQNDVVNSHGATKVFYAGNRFPEGTRLRLVVRGEKIRNSLAARIFRLRCRLFGPDRLLGPDEHIMQADAAATSDEFKEP